jgi:quercetin dioxygenase-like cupin family protein
VSRRGDVYENRVTGERAVVLRGDDDGGGQSALVHLAVQPHGAVVGEHVHRGIRERFLVVSGRLGMRLDGREATLTAGQEAVAEPGVAHDWWNAGDEVADVVVELSPPDPRFEQMIQTLFGLANAGKTNAKGMPDPLQLALIATEFADVIRFTKPPAPVQKLAFALLGALGRARGKRGVYPGDGSGVAQVSRRMSATLSIARLETTSSAAAIHSAVWIPTSSESGPQRMSPIGVKAIEPNQS